MDQFTTINDLTPDPRNARKHGERNITAATKSLKAYGAARSIVVDETGRILAGNGVVQAAASAGISRVKTVETDGTEIVAVMRRGLTEKQKLGLAIADNRVAEMAEWDATALADISQEIDMKPFFTDKEMARILNSEDELSGDQMEELESSFSILITCTSEQEQAKLLERFTAEGLECRSLIA